ncbi:MAG: DUF3160 domain-containing protein [Fibrobacteria bacterium]
MNRSSIKSVNRSAIVLAGILFSAASLLAAADARDFNGDGAIDLADAKAFLARVSAGSAAYDAKLDCNRDSKVDLADALLFGKWVNGMWSDTSFPNLVFGAPQDRALFSAYAKGKSDNAGMTKAGLQTAYPSHALAGDLDYRTDTVEFVSRVDSAFATLPGAGNLPALGTSFTGRVLKTGMAVYTQGEFKNFQSALDFVHTQDLPLLFTTDALLNTVYRSYDNILMALEENSLIPALDKILAASLAEVDRAHAGRDYAAPVLNYFQTARNLLAGTSTEQNLTAKGHPFGRDVEVDWTQFKPRGHYTRSVKLQQYFRAMMWLSRADLSLQIGGPADSYGKTTKANITLMKKSSLAIWDAVVNSGSYPAWRDMTAVIAFMVGKSDGLSIDGMGQLVHAMGDSAIPAYLPRFEEKRFDQVVAAGDFGMQTILSNISFDTVPSARIFAFMPQRFIMDSYTFSEVVNAGQVSSLVPSSLDIAFMLGDNSALTDHPSPNAQVLAAQRQLYDKLSPAGYGESLYGMWLSFLRKLNGAEDNAKLSPVFRTLGWRKKMRNTQLYSWAHLRHNTILYAKQSYTSSITCSHPHAYVEPYPEFFHAVGDYARKGSELFRMRDAQVAAYFDRLAEISGRLEDAARTIASGSDPTDEQVAWLRNCVSADHKTSPGGYGGTYGFKVYNGWYFDLIYDAAQKGPVTETDGSEPSYSSIADVHTKPSDERDPRNLVLHAATGYVNLMGAAIRLKDCTSLFVGPTGTFYDVVTDSIPFQRLNDDAWEEMLKRKDAKVKPPAWTESIRY